MFVGWQWCHPGGRQGCCGWLVGAAVEGDNWGVEVEVVLR
jgi:hypothetical protein